jgi:predicted DNA-binding ribbon-helix-helix protein
MATIERVQTGVRIERRILGVLKAVAELHQMTLGDLLEGLALHAFEGKLPFSAATLKKIESLKAAFELDLTAADSHRLEEGVTRARSRRAR